jgi:hypothetical protein
MQVKGNVSSTLPFMFSSGRCHMANALRAPQEPPDENLSPDEEAFYAYMEGLRRELEQNWNGGYAQMPNEVRSDRTLSHKAKEIYEQLLSYMWFKSDRCWPSQSTLASDTGYSRRSVIRALNELYERGYIEKWRRGLGLTNYYFINPLSFVRSFRPLPHNNILSVNAPELRLDLSKATPRPVEPIYTEVPNSHNGSDNGAQQEMPNWHTKHTQTNPDSVETQKRYTRSADGAELGVKGGVASATIRKDTKGTKGTNEDQQRNQSKTKSNTTVPSQETGGAARAEEVKEVRKSRRKKHAPGEVPPPLPEYLESVFLAPISLHFCDQARGSSKTSFAWIYAEVRQRGLDEYSEPFHDLINEARDETKVRASRGEIRGRNRDGSIAMMPYFLSVLETNVHAWCKAFDKAAAKQSEQEESANGLPLENESESREEDAKPLPAAPSVEEEHLQHDVSAPANVEPSESDQQEPVAAPQRCIATDDPEHGWSEINAAHFADRLRDVLGGNSYWQYRVVPTLVPGRYGFILKEIDTGHEWEYATEDEYNDTVRANRR